VDALGVTWAVCKVVRSIPGTVMDGCREVLALSLKEKAGFVASTLLCSGIISGFEWSGCKGVELITDGDMYCGVDQVTLVANAAMCAFSVVCMIGFDARNKVTKQG